jgi:hypothetical protein
MPNDEIHLTINDQLIDGTKRDSYILQQLSKEKRKK